MRAKFITAVALYGAKQGALKELIQAVQGIIGERLGGAFRPYTLEQVHSTLINLNWFADETSGLPINRRYHDIAGVSRPMAPDQALETIYASLEPPINIRIGGYKSGDRATFSSRGEHPYERMFSDQKGTFVLVGWPLTTIACGISEKPLDDLRRRLLEANILHLYHDSPADIDNDFHVVVGHYQEAVSEEIAATVGAVREYLAEHPVELAIGSQQLAIVASDSPTLMPARFVGRIPQDYKEVMELFR
jgi:hypothetical protein